MCMFYILWFIAVADTLLWKNKRQTLAVLLALVAIYYNFIASGATIITAVSKLLLLSLFLLFIHGSLPNRMYGYTVEKIPASNFHLSEEKSRNIVMLMVSTWNGGVNALKSLCKGKDWILLFRVFFSLLLLSFLGAVSFHCFCHRTSPRLYSFLCIRQKGARNRFFHSRSFINGVQIEIWYFQEDSVLQEE
ncbi:3beta-hydroxysteroid-dehydrogenase/decarboxylase-like [Hibiscus syriacus]|uniref:3beta-hydroxysteroid- dehydrogenase/decarboxylase-like n=1 Tax=Hibiscus syriacus TaxID=106335 RepID=UPI001921123F|nr:3beta-hydroxysteroid-dehydrogenase/decarboxylase-like [Hibiscus syriacus]